MRRAASSGSTVVESPRLYRRQCLQCRWQARLQTLRRGRGRRARISPRARLLRRRRRWRRRRKCRGAEQLASARPSEMQPTAWRRQPQRPSTKRQWRPDGLPPWPRAPTAFHHGDGCPGRQRRPAPTTGRSLPEARGTWMRRRRTPPEAPPGWRGRGTSRCATRGSSSGVIRGNPLSSTTCLTHDFFKSGEYI